MKEFQMCELCKEEYSDIYNRRFHAQPVACNHCGPQYTLHLKHKSIHDTKMIIDIAAELTTDGKIIAIKGLGGYNLMCDAENETAVSNLRYLKNRESKAFAVMFKDIETLKEYAFINETEKEALLSWQRPIVLLKSKKKLAPSAANELANIGAMLPYMPFHHLFFEKISIKAVVLTSGNFSDEPIIISNKIALNSFNEKVDAVITYNRQIHNRTDDSVGIVINNKFKLFRRSRGYAPASHNTNLNTEGIFAAGAEFVNCFCIGKDKRAFMSQHIGDLKNLETYEFYTESFQLYKRLFRFEPKIIVTDLHPDYLSTKFAEALIENNPDIEMIKVQHHHSHIASCMAEHNLDEKVIGISFDGVGLGTDKNIWGSEFFICDLIEFERFTHFEYINVSGGDAVSKHPWRSALSYLYHYFGKNYTSKLLSSFIDETDTTIAKMYLNVLESDFNTYKTSSAGRIFDAVSSLISLVHTAGYHAEAPMKLESITEAGINDTYNYVFNGTISFKKTFEGIIKDLDDHINTSAISTKFHNTIINVICETAEIIRKRTGLNKIVLSGGTFQNKYLSEKTEKRLNETGFELFTQEAFPSNDGGIALGQLLIAAKRRSLSEIK